MFEIRGQIFFLLGLICAVSSQAQIINGSFEDWYSDTQGYKRLYGWHHMQKDGDSSLMQGIFQETESQHLLYALKLSRWYDYTWDKALQKVPLTTNPGIVTGYYKYEGNDLFGDRNKDTAYLSVKLTKWSHVLQKAEIIAKGYLEFNTTNDFKKFECPLKYFSSTMADTITIEISPSKFYNVIATCTTGAGRCSYFTLDNLSLQGTGIFSPIHFVYPNPATSSISVDLSSIEQGEARIINALGQTLYKKAVTGRHNEFNVAFLISGIYFLQFVGSGGKIESFKFIKK